MKTILSTLLLSAGIASAEDATLPALWEAVKNQHPAARVAEATRQAADGEWNQARAWDNPELSVEGESLGGDFSGTDEAEWTLALEQAIEWPGRRARRLRAAAIDRKGRTWESKAQLRELANTVYEVFYDTLALQERMLLHMAAVEQAEAFVTMAQRRIEAGTSTVLEANKAQLERARHELQLAEDEQALLNALEHIGRMAGWAEAPDVLLGEFYQAPPPPDRDEIQQALATMARYALPQAALKRQQIALTNAERAWLPDLVVSAGIRQNDADDTQSYVGGLGLSLPIWNRGSGEKVTARAQLEQARSAQALAELNQAREVNERSAALNQQWKTIQGYQQELLPLLARHAKQAKTSYEEGWISYLEYLDARSDHREQQHAYIDTLKNYHLDLHTIRPLTETDHDN